MRLIDVVNFNGDASCLATSDWLNMLRGGSDAPFYRWLQLYVQSGSRVVLGLPGATASDIAAHNPESIALVRTHPDIFQIIVRPYSHDLALVRTERGFSFNLDTGERLLQHLFGRLAPFYLAPEFMLTSSQVGLLAKRGMATFVFADRLEAHVAAELPNAPFELVGTGDRRTLAIPFHCALTRAYLRTVQLLDASQWQGAVAAVAPSTAYLWRDGESVFLLPDSLRRERAWLNAASGMERAFLEAGDLTEERCDRATSFPLPSFSAWVREMKMYWFIEQLREIELGFAALDKDQRGFFLQAINSDILSSIEKKPPLVELAEVDGTGACRTHVIARHSRALEGEDYLSLLRDGTSCEAKLFLAKSNSPHMVKLRGRLSVLAELPAD
jgi:hypothetical protein